MESFKEVQQNNKLIAEFIGGKIISKSQINEIWSFSDFPIKETCLDGDLFSTSLNFNEDWNKIMLVIDFIDIMKDIYNFQVITQSNFTSFLLSYKNNYYEFTHSSYDKLECLYTVVIRFIKWYNNQ